MVFSDLVHFYLVVKLYLFPCPNHSSFGGKDGISQVPGEPLKSYYPAYKAIELTLTSLDTYCSIAYSHVYIFYPFRT